MNGACTRWVLPRRELGDTRHLGWIFVAIGFIGTMFLLSWMASPLQGAFRALEQGSLFGLFLLGFAAMGLFGLVPSLAILMAGLSIVANRTSCVVEVDDRYLRVIDRLPFGWLRRKRLRSAVVGLRSVASWSQSDPSPEAGRPPTGFDQIGGALIAQLPSGGEKLAIAVGYPRSILEPLAADLATVLGVPLSSSRGMLARVAEQVAEQDSERLLDRSEREEMSSGRTDLSEDFADDSEFPESLDANEATSDETVNVPSPPDGTIATIDRREDGVTISVPPVGIRQGAQGLLFFSVLWNLFMTVFTAILFFAMTGAIEQKQEVPGWLAVLFVIPFWAVGIGLVIAVINAGRSHATVATADRLLMVVRHSIFGKVVREWSAEDLLSIECGASGIEVNDRPIKELRIVPVEGVAFGLLRQLTEPEIEWIACELNRALQVTRAPRDTAARLASGVARSESGWAQPAAGSPIVVDRMGDRLSIRVPPRGWGSQTGGVIFGILCLGAAVALPYFLGAPKHRDVGDLMMLALGMGIALLLGLGTLAATCVAARRRFDLSATRDELVLVRRGPFGAHEFKWRRDELSSIRVASVGAAANQRPTNQQPVFQVQIAADSAPVLGIMTSHPRPDLAFVAVALSEHLELP